MHILISWDIKAEGVKWNNLNQELRECLKGYSWVKPLKTVYIVKIAELDDRQSIRESLTAVCSSNKGLINCIVTPAMEGGSYNGWLPKRLWSKIRERVEVASEGDPSDE